MHLSDRILQHILLKQLKPTFKHVINPNVYHLVGPTGVKHATSGIKEVLEKEKHKYFLRVDIRSYYASIPHYKLLNDIKQHYHDPKIIAMLETLVNINRMLLCVSHRIRGHCAKLARTLG